MDKFQELRSKDWTEDSTAVGEPAWWPEDARRKRLGYEYDGDGFRVPFRGDTAATKSLDYSTGLRSMAFASSEHERVFRDPIGLVQDGYQQTANSRHGLARSTSPIGTAHAQHAFSSAYGHPLYRFESTQTKYDQQNTIDFVQFIPEMNDDIQGVPQQVLPNEDPNHRIHACPHCHKRYKYRKDLARHVQRHEPSRREYYCPFPGCEFHTKSVDSQDHLDRHLAVLHGTNLPIRMFSTTSSLDHHLAAGHRDHCAEPLVDADRASAAAMVSPSQRSHADLPMLTAAAEEPSPAPTEVHRFLNSSERSYTPVLDTASPSASKSLSNAAKDQEIGGIKEAIFSHPARANDLASAIHATRLSSLKQTQSHRSDDPVIIEQRVKGLSNSVAQLRRTVNELRFQTRPAETGGCSGACTPSGQRSTHQRHRSIRSASPHERGSRSRSAPPFDRHSGCFKKTLGSPEETNRGTTSGSSSSGAAGSSQGTRPTEACALSQSFGRKDGGNIGMKRRKPARIGPTAVKTGFQCIFFAGEPQVYSDHVQRYIHISLLLRHVKGHYFHACQKCFRQFDTSVECESHDCTKACTNISCRRHVATAADRPELCQCITSAYQQWQQLYYLAYPAARPTPDTPGGPVSALPDPLLATESSSTFSPEADIGRELPTIDADTHRSANTSDPDDSIIPSQGNIAALQAWPLIQALTTEMQTLQAQVQLLQQRVSSQPSQREEELETTLGIVWREFCRTGSAEAQPDSFTWRLVRRDAPRVLRTATISSSSQQPAPIVQESWPSMDQGMVDIDWEDLTNIPDHGNTSTGSAVYSAYGSANFV